MTQAPPPPYGTPMNKPAAADSVPLFASAQERDQHERLAELYSLIKAVEMLERAFVRDAVSSKDYAPACKDLIAKYRTALKLCPPGTELHRFVAETKLDCKAAVERLTVGRPDVSEESSESNKGGARVVAEAVQHFITAMDSLKLHLVAADQIHPILSDLSESLQKVPSLPADWECKTKLQHWLATLDKMQASDELRPEQTRQLLFDLESSYAAFHKLLN